MDADDAFWAAKQVMAFTDEEIRAIVQTGEYSDAAATEWVTKCLIERRNKIGNTFYSRVLPLDRFEIQGGRLRFDNSGAEQAFTIQWHEFDNATGALQTIEGANTVEVPQTDSLYQAAEIRTRGRGQSLMVYVRDRQEIVGRENRVSEALLLTRR